MQAVMLWITWFVNTAWNGIIHAPTQSVVSGTALLFSLASFWESRRRGLAAARFDQTMTLLEEWRKDLVTYRQHFNSISRKLSRDPAHWRLGYGKQTQEDRVAIERISHYFDHVGWLLITKNLDERLLLTSIGPPIIRHWLILQNCLDIEREFRRTEAEGESGIENEPLAIAGKPPGLYQAGFEHLANVAHRRYRRYYIKAERADFDVPGYPNRQLRH